MTVTKYILYIPLIFLIIQSCMEPEVEDLWSIGIDSIMETSGFARDLTIHDNTAIIAAGQSGVQVWDLLTSSMMQNFSGYEEGGTFLEFDDLALIHWDKSNNLIFASESNKDVKIFHYDGGDILAYRNTIMSAKTKDFITFPSNIDQFIMYSADNDDGMKWHYYNLDTTNSYGIEFIQWTPYGGAEIDTPGKPLGIDSDGSTMIAMAVDQLGVELFSIDSLGAEPVFIGRVDTQGNAEKVSLSLNGVYVACDDAGASYITLENFNGTGELIYFAKDLTVDHIAVKENIASLSIGPKGIALYDVSDPLAPQEKGIFPIGYSYMSMFWGDKLLVCTREGLQQITIEK